MKVAKLCPWPPGYNNSGYRLILPHILTMYSQSYAFARNTLTTDAGIALSRGVSSQRIQTQRPRHSGTTLSLWPFSQVT
eukprot:6945352-Pyramimonas_sp.AAC.1